MGLIILRGEVSGSCNIYSYIMSQWIVQKLYKETTKTPFNADNSLCYSRSKSKSNLHEATMDKTILNILNKWLEIENFGAQI